MRAADLAADYPVVSGDDDALAAARLLAERRLPGLVVTDDGGIPRAILPGSQVLRFAIPGYVQDDPALARVYDERHADRMCATLRGTPVRELLPKEPREIPVVDPDATVVEIAAVMARMRSPLVAVVAGERLLGVITLPSLLTRLLPE